MTRFFDVSDFSRGELDPDLHSRQDADFYKSAAVRLSNFYPDRVGGVYKRPPLRPVLREDRVLSQPFDEPTSAEFWSTGIFGVKKSGIGLDLGSPVRRAIFADSEPESHGVVDVEGNVIPYTTVDYHTEIIVLNELYFLAVFEHGVSPGADAATFSQPDILIMSVLAIDRDTHEVKVEGGVHRVLLSAPFGYESTELTIYSDINDPLAKIGRLSDIIHIAAAGPAAFIATGVFSVKRLFLKEDGTLGFENVLFFEELAGKMTYEPPVFAFDSGEYSRIEGEGTLFELQIGRVGTGEPPRPFIRVGNKFFKVLEVESDTVLKVEAESSPGERVEGKEIPSFGGSGTVTVYTHDPILTQTRGAVGAFKKTFGNGQYPALVSFYQNRLVLAVTPDKPTGIWLSKSSDPFVILPANTDDSSPIAEEIFLPNVTKFVWLVSKDRLFLGSYGAEVAIGDGSGIMTPQTFSASLIGNTGSAPTGVVSVGGASFVHVDSTRQRLFLVQFEFQSQSFASQDITLLATHLFQQPVYQLVYRPATGRDSTARIYALLDDGTVRVCAFAPGQNVLAWSRVEFSFGAGLKVVSLTASPDTVYFLFYDPVGGRYILTFEGEDTGLSDIMDMPFQALMNGQSFLVPPMFAGAQVGVFLRTPPFSEDNYEWLGTFPVVAGTPPRVILPAEVPADSAVRFGAVYDAEAELLPPVDADKRGTMLNRKTRIVRVLVDLLDSSQLYIEGSPIQAEIPARAGQRVTGVYSKRLLGWKTRRTTELSVPSIYSARVRSVTREVSA